MRRTDFGSMDCSVARTLEVVGEWWAMLVIREAFNGVRRFDEFQARLGIARNVLAARLRGLVEYGILERRIYQAHPARYEYRLTEKGMDLYPVLLSLMHWGDCWRVGPEGPPVRLYHRACGHRTEPRMVCSECGETLSPIDVRAEGLPPTRRQRTRATQADQTSGQG